VPLKQQAKKAAPKLAVMIDADYQGKVRLLLNSRSEKKYVRNIG
jgi:dUTPase